MPDPVDRVEVRHIPFFNYSMLYAAQRQELLKLMDEVCSRGAFIMQKDLTEFEQALARYVGVRHCIGVADGTVALTISLRASGIRSGDEVIVPSHTFAASAAAIAHAGAVPVLADCGPDHLLDPADVPHRITTRTRGIMPVQLNGRTADMDRLGEIALKHHLLIIEDSAQALGSKFKGRCAGTFGAAGTCSFYPSKTLGCFGDGGAVLTNDDSIAAKARLLRDHGRAETGDVVEWGYNARLDNLQAAVLHFKLMTYAAAIEKRRALAHIYRQLLEDVPGLVLPPGPDGDADHYDIFQNYEIEADRRDELRIHLEKRGVRTILQWGGKTLHQFPVLKLNTDVPFTERMTHRFMLLPMNTTLSEDDARHVGNSVRSFYGMEAR